MDTTIICPLCAGKANRTYEGMKGYIEGKTYNFYECENCEASFANPLKSDDAVYNHIYSHPERIPGYERYVRYSKLVKQVSKPLEALSNAENTYWSIQEALKKSFDRNDISIAEIGSGLGYLTYSLNKAGYTARGIDISSDAVAKPSPSLGRRKKVYWLYLYENFRSNRVLRGKKP